MQTVIADIKFLDRLKQYDNKNIPQKTLLAVRQMVMADNFNPKDIVNRSKAAGGLAKWCKATYQYAEAWKIVKPKEQKQRELSEKLRVAEEAVAIKKDELGVIKGEIEKMETEYNHLMEYI